MQKAHSIIIFLAFCFAAYIFFQFEPWPEKYLFLFDKKEDFFEMPKFKENCNISDFGAINDEKTKNTKAFKDAINSCFKKGGGNVIVPRGKWLTGAIHLQSNINLELMAGSEIIFSKEPADYLPVVQTRWEGIELYNYSPFIYANGAENVSITGSGKLTGQGKTWQDWNDKQDEAFKSLYAFAQNKTSPVERIFGTKKDALRPSFVQFFNCKNILLKDFSIQDGPMWTIHVVFSENITAEKLHISSLGYNSDGFVIDSSKNVLLNKLEIASGDDAVSIKSGLESDIWNQNIPSENIIIKNTRFNAGHAGIAIGSEMSGGIKNVQIKQSYFSNLDWAVRMKSLRGRGGLIENISAKNLKLYDVNQFLAIDLQYSSPTLAPSTQEPPRVKNVRMEKINGNDVEELFYLRGLPESPLQNITLKNIIVNANGMSEIINSEKVFLENITTDNEKERELSINDSRDIFFSKSKLCKQKKSNCITIDGKDNDAIHFIGTNVKQKNIDLNDGAIKEVVSISN